MAINSLDKDVEDGRVAAVIPAKLTSVRLPQKNIADFAGKPLFYYSARIAMLCEDITHVYVSSESETVLDMAEKYGCKTILRPANLSSPEIKNIDVLIHALQTIATENIIPEFLVLLQPTHPFRFPEELKKGIEEMKKNKEADVLVTVCPDDRLSGKIVGSRFIPDVTLPRNRKTEPPKYFNTGSFYIFRTSTTLLKDKMFTDNILPLILSRPEFEIDIDWPNDLLLARKMIETYKEQFSFFWD